ncbi:DNA internalization-related competence protein ComEC/Rec2 [Natribacillus halophilus]|uniref:Competence protein ComEC n=1 Tax=Natribacillus halophilus TaxID=549003 RepID=A0A1G8JU29_9BACI|nr:DNA internalization-related competence protein ComEC/Rec2 [Natribacillus halophilus]SDI34641.1 competence protein ComEC [Natribacillus halophilus]
MRGQSFLWAVAACFGVAAALSPHQGLIISSAFIVFGYLSFKNRSFFTLLTLVFVGVCTFIWAYVYDEQNDTVLSEHVHTIQGRVDNVPELDGDRISFFLQLPEHNERVQVSARVTEEDALAAFQQLNPGHECTIAGEISTPSSARNFNAFDYQNYLYEQGVHWTLQHVHGEDEMSCREADGTWLTSLKQWRHTGIRYIEDVFPPELQGLAAALLFGERSHMEADTLEAYQDLGIIHLLAISGLHVGIVSGFLFLLFVRSGISRERVCELLLLLLPVYALLAGAAPSVLRAVLMTCFVLLCFRFRIQLQPIDGISLAFLVLLMHDPYLLFHVGFQLSFTISFALIASAAIFRQAKRRIHQFMLVSMLAQVISFPLIVYHFHTYSLVSLPLNIIYVPIVSLIILPMVWILFFLSMLTTFLASFWFFLLENIVAFLHGFFTFLHQNGGMIAVFGRPSGVWVIAMFVIIIVALILFEKRRKTVIFAISLFVATAIFQYVQPYVDGQLRVTFIDVGQGDSILIELPYRQAVYLIDGGGTVMFPREDWQEREQQPDPGRQTVVPYLQSLGIRHVDKVIVTHGDYDHYGGLFAVTEQMDVGTLLYPRVEVDGPAVEAFLLHAREQGAELAFVHEGMHWSVGAYTFQILHPTRHGDGQTDNDDSIVIDANMYDTRWLFTGDLEAEGEQRLVREYPHLRADVLKAGHHGSQTSTTQAFVEHLEPTAAVISAGKDNRYNHPHPDVISNLEEADVHIYRTDLQGAIRFVYQDTGWKVERKVSE